MSTTSSTGLASGIDSASIISSLITAERQAIVPTENKKTSAETELSAAQNLNTLFSYVVTDANYLQEASTFSAKSSTSGDEDVLTVAATADATVGTYSIRVDSVAQAEEVIGNAVSSTDTFTGTLTITLGDGTAFSYEAKNATIATIAAAINSSNSTAEVEAEAVEVGDGTYRLMLTSDKTGAANTITLGGDLATSGPFATVTTLTNAQDASLTMRLGSDNTIEITRTSSTNSFTDILSGVSIAVKSTSDDFVSVQVESDTSEVTTRISTFIDSLNAALSSYALSAAYDSGSDEVGVFFTNNQLRTQVSAINRAFDATASDGTTLEKLGITKNSDTGLYELDKSTLEALLTSDPDAVSGFFVDSGIGAAVNTAVSGMTDKSTGVLTQLEDQLSTSIDDYEDQVTAFDDMLASRKARYQAQFLAMETTISKLNSQKSALTSFIDGLNSSD
jgi:flagellar hook-associated protein 2